ncbi:MAG: tetratricopeptide repeat protein [Chitinophagales bacterium]
MQPFIPHFIQEQYIARHFNGSIEGCVLFVDISGFTPMTQQLMDKGQKEGAEILSNILNSIFEVMVKEIYHAQGFITHFAGDAFTAIFPIQKPNTPKNTAIAALQCAQTIQDFFREHGKQYSKYGHFDLQVKIGLSYGQTDWGIVGDEYIMGVQACKFYFRGIAINQATYAEQKANKGETILSQNFKATLKKTPLIGSFIEADIFRFEGFEGFEGHNNTIFSKSHPPQLPDINSDILDRFIPSEIITFREKGEFRNIISVFISFKNIHTHQELNTFASIVLKHIIRYKGDLKEIDFGDKGALMIGFFGAPVAYENDLARALHFVEEVKNEVKEWEILNKLQFRMGITTGKVYAGIIGGKYRCEYTCLGDIVNMAARITMQAQWQEIWVQENIAAHPNFTFRKKGVFSYKGFNTPIATYEYLGSAENKTVQQNNMPIIGQGDTLKLLSNRIAPIFERKPSGITYIFGEAGIGKTRLAYALKEKTFSTTQWIHITADPILQKPFQPFKDMLAAHFRFPKSQNPSAKKDHFDTAIQSLVLQLNQNIASLELQNQPHEPLFYTLNDAKSELLRTKSILASQIGITYSEENLMQQLDAKGRYENTILAIQNFLKVLSLLQPLVIHLEDSQWLDNDSIALLQKLVNNLESYPIALLSTARYKDDGSQALLPFKNLSNHIIELTYLQPKQVKALAETQLNQHNNNGWIPLSKPLLKVLVERSKGNPFFVEQLLRFFGENQWLQNRTGTWQLTQQVDSVPDSIQALLMARIDRLSKQVKEVTKVAAVLGREFDIQLLSAILHRNVLAETKVAETEQIWHLLQGVKGIFRHTLLRDMAYDMQLKERLRQLHQLAAVAMEGLYSKNHEEKYADIAFHYEKAETTIKSIEYLEKAGMYAQENFQNQQALDLFERLLKQLQNLKDPDLTWKILLKKAAVLRTIGKWDAAQEVYEDAMELARMFKNEAYIIEIQFNLARIFSLQGKYQTSLNLYQQILTAYKSTNNKTQIANTIGYMGVVHINLSEYEKAAKCFQQQISLASELGDEKNHATALGNLGSLFNQIGNHEAAMDCYRKSYELFEKIGSPQNAAMNLANMGTIATVKDDYDSAMDYYQKSLKRFEKTGYQHGIAYTIVNIGYTFMQKGLYNEAFSYYEKSLRLSLQMKDRRLQAFAEGNIGMVHYHKNNCELALPYLDKAIEGHHHIGFKYSLAEWYWAKALCLYELMTYSRALDWVKQSIDISREITRTDMLFKAQLLKGKIHFKMGEQITATAQLQTLLDNSEEEEEKAFIHFELWQMYEQQVLQQKKASKARNTSEASNLTHKEKSMLSIMAENHHQKALHLFQQLFAIKAKQEFEGKINLLKAS